MFTWTRSDFANEVVRADKRGCTTEIIIDRHAAAGAGQKIMRLFKSVAIPVRVNSSQGLLHHKMMYIDSEKLLLGSANWTLSAFEKNDDFFLTLSPLTKKQQEQMNNLWRRIEQESVFF